jgi:hypothetical protein
MECVKRLAFARRSLVFVGQLRAAKLYATFPCVIR